MQDLEAAGERLVASLAPLEAHLQHRTFVAGQELIYFVYHTLQLPVGTLYLLLQLCLIVLYEYFLMSVADMVVVLDALEAVRAKQDALAGTVDHMGLAVFLAPVL